jgi:superfamily II DNA or RNA helicase
MKEEQPSFSLPDLIDNRKVTGKNLADVLKTLLLESNQPKLSIATAFFNLDALRSLEETVLNLSSLRLLLGKEQEQEFVLGGFREDLETAISQSLSLSLSEIQDWLDFLKDDLVQIRLYEKSFLHGKAYLLEGVPFLGSVGIVGSSNFTGAGLKTNLELNAVLKQESAVNELKRWFEALWEESVDYKSEFLSILSDFTHPYTPYEIYIKILYEAWKDRFGTSPSEEDGKPSPIALTDFQHQGYLAAKEILENYGGVLIADSVGLGKTYLVLRLLDDYAYHERQTALIICPASLIDSLWRPLLQGYAIPHELVSMEKVSQADFPFEEYAQRFKIIVVDESHNFRNSQTNRWKNLFRLITNGDNDKKIILLTATPINNSVFDLYNQIRFITKDFEDFFKSVGIRNLFSYFCRADADKDTLYEVLEAIAVRRSRQFIRSNYPRAKIDGKPIHFPERELHSVHYSLSAIYGKPLYDRLAYAIETLFFAPYQPDYYRKDFIEAMKRWREGEDSRYWQSLKERLTELGWDERRAEEFAKTYGRQRALVNIMRILYLKRLESSVEAMRNSLIYQRDFQKAFLQALQKGRLLDSKSYRKWLQELSTDDESEDGRDIREILDSLPILPKEEYDIQALEEAVEADIRSLNELIGELEKLRAERDDKLETLRNLLLNEMKGKKTIIFSYFKDTARYIYNRLRNDKDFMREMGLTAEQFSIIDSEVKPEERLDRIRRFAPEANQFKEKITPDREIHLLISTDVLSEGQNLQDACVLINYDLHWNPVRMVQRAGRLDRIGSPHDLIHIYNFFPEDELESLLHLLQRLYEKLEAINRAVGLDAPILGEMPNPMDFNTLRRIEQRDESVIDELESESELNIGEFLMEDLLNFLKSIGERKLSRIPNGVGTSKKGERKGFFLSLKNLKTDKHYWLFEDENGNLIGLRGDRLEAIEMIRSKPDEPALPIPSDFDPRVKIEELRERLMEIIRQSAYRKSPLKAPQNKLVSWLRTLPPSSLRNELLNYFSQPLNELALRDLRRIWKERTRKSEQEFMRELADLSRRYPQAKTKEEREEEKEIWKEDLEVIGWVLLQ